MDRSRWISLATLVVYVVVFIVVPLSADQERPHGEDGRLFIAQFAGGFLAFLGFACVWWSEALGDALWIGRGAWNPQPSSSGAVKVLGWLFLIAAFTIHVIVNRWIN